MSTIVKLPDDATALLRDDTDLTNRDVKALRRSARHAASIANKLQELGFDEENPSSWKVIAELSDDEDDVLDEFQRTCVIKRLSSWTVKNEDGSDRPIPTTVDEVDDLPRPIYVPLTVAAADIKLSDDFSVDAHADPPVATESSDS